MYKYTLTCDIYSRFATKALCFCYWVPLLLTGIIHTINPEWKVYPIAGLTVWIILVVVVLKCVVESNTGQILSWKEYMNDFVCYGSSHLF